MKEDKEYATDYRYGDQFKEDLIHQLWHLVEEVRKVHENLKKTNEELDYIRQEIRSIGR
jgi:hypothetical protein